MDWFCVITIQVRVFVHSASGQVMEQDVSTTCPEALAGPEGAARHTSVSSLLLKELPESVVAHEEEECVDPTLAHNFTTTKSEAMELTLEGGDCPPVEASSKFEEEPYIEQVL